MNEPPDSTRDTVEDKKRMVIRSVSYRYDTRQARVMRPGLTAGALGPSIVSLITLQITPPPTPPPRRRRPSNCLELRLDLVGCQETCGAASKDSEEILLLLFIAAGPITNLFVWREGTVEDMCCAIRRANKIICSLMSP